MQRKVSDRTALRPIRAVRPSVAHGLHYQQVTAEVCPPGPVDAVIPQPASFPLKTTPSQATRVPAGGLSFFFLQCGSIRRRHANTRVGGTG
jgi:hypothetical protein